jgi:hypothetical protein
MGAIIRHPAGADLADVGRVVEHSASALPPPSARARQSASIGQVAAQVKLVCQGDKCHALFVELVLEIQLFSESPYESVKVINHHSRI